MPATPEPTTRVRRIPELQRHDRHELDAVLDAGLVAHVGIVDDGQPYVLPLAYVRDGDRLLLHGSTGSRLLRALAAGAPACVTVTLLDALVVARSAFESSMQYRCAMVLGSCRPVEDVEVALRRFTDGLLPGRSSEVRPSRPKEVAATLLLELPLEHWSVKVSEDDPEDDEQDLAGNAWAGVLPIETRYGRPRPSGDLRPGIDVPASVRQLELGTITPP